MISFVAYSNTARVWYSDSQSVTEFRMLVYFERHETAMAGIQREKNIKHWPREWKIDLIVSMNPRWQDLYEEIVK